MDKKPEFGAGLRVEPAAADKKPYAAPTLVRWGTLREITLKVGNAGGTDNGTKKNQQRTR